MGSDLFSACVFCAALLLGADPAPFPGTSGETIGTYASFQRLFDESETGGKDGSDITPKFITVGARWVSLPPPGEGAGTPRREVRLRLALAPSHDEQEQTPGFPSPSVRATGTGRFENASLLYRQPLSRKDSVELGIVRRSHQATDLVRFEERDPPLFERPIAVERAELALGWRHRFSGAEIAAAGRSVKVEGRHRTGTTFHHSTGRLIGGWIEGRVRRGRWTGSLSGERMRGDLDVLEESEGIPTRRFDSPASLDAISAGVGWAGQKSDVWFSVTYDRSKLPFVAVAVLGAEQSLFDAGYHPESESRETVWDLSIRRGISPGVRVRLVLRAIYGEEDVALTDRVGSLPPVALRIRRGGDTGKGYDLLDVIGLPQISIGLGLDFRLGTSKP